MSESKDQSVGVPAAEAETAIGEIELSLEPSDKAMDAIVGDPVVDRDPSELTIGTYPWKTTEAAELLSQFNGLRISSTAQTARTLTKQRNEALARVAELEVKHDEARSSTKTPEDM